MMICPVVTSLIADGSFDLDEMRQHMSNCDHCKAILFAVADTLLPQDDSEDSEDAEPTNGWPEPITGRPRADTLGVWYDEGAAEATDGCWVELDGICPHGFPSWLLYLGMI